MVKLSGPPKCGKCKNYKPRGSSVCPYCVAQKHKKEKEQKKAA